jgi:hypothetical protein
MASRHQPDATALGALSAVLCNDDVVSRTPRILGLLSCVSKDARLMVETSQATRRYNNQFALAVVKGKLAMRMPFACRRNVACTIMNLSHTIGSFVKCHEILSQVEGSFTVQDMENLEDLYTSRETDHPLAVEAQAEEIWRFLGQYTNGTAR